MPKKIFSPLYGQLLIALVAITLAAAAFLTISAHQSIMPQANQTQAIAPTPSATAIPSEGGYCSGADLDSTCPSNCPQSSDIDCCTSTGNCWIQGAGCVFSGLKKSECQNCNPLKSKFEWSNLPDGEGCPSDSNHCTQDACAQGSCQHAALANGTLCPSGACCNSQCKFKPACSDCQEGPVCEKGEWVCKNKPKGIACADSQARQCTKGQCDGQGSCETQVIENYCLISSNCFASDSQNPANGCLYCAPAQTQTTWAAKKDGTVCQGDGNPCTQDACASGACQHSAEPTGTACPDDELSCTSDSCNANASCSHYIKQGFCAIEGKCYQNGAANPSNSCAYCNATINPVNWAMKSENAPCGSAAGECGASYCQKGKCVQAEKPDGTPCASDNYSCTNDACIAGECTHEVSTGCLVSGACVKTGEKNPSNQCLACSPEKSTFNWTALLGQACTDDGNECTKDACNQQAQCEHSNKPKGSPCTPDSNLCTSDECNGLGACSHSQRPAGAVCSRTNYCTPSQICTAKACDAQGACGTPGGTCYSCNQTSHTLCRATSCNTVVNFCTNTGGAWKWSTNSSCDDSDPCTKGDSCTAGACKGTGYNPIEQCGAYMLLDCPATSGKNLTAITAKHFFKTNPTCEGVNFSAIYLEDGSAAEVIKSCENNTLSLQLATLRPGKYNLAATDIDANASKTCTIRRFGEVPTTEFPDYDLALLPLLAILALLALRAKGFKR